MMNKILSVLLSFGIISFSNVNANSIVQLNCMQKAGGVIYPGEINKKCHKRCEDLLPPNSGDFPTEKYKNCYKICTDLITVF